MPLEARLHAASPKESLAMSTMYRLIVRDDVATGEAGDRTWFLGLAREAEFRAAALEACGGKTETLSHSHFS